MKPSVIVTVVTLSFFILMAQGCTSNDKSGSGRESSVTLPESATELAVKGNVPPVIPASDPAANGGFNLPASSAYNQPAGATVQQQNVNPTPFLTLSTSPGQVQTAGAPAGAPGLTLSGSLTSRADGTMSGPHDQPAATTGWGTSATNWGQSAPSGAKRTTHPTNKPKK